MFFASLPFAIQEIICPPRRGGSTPPTCAMGRLLDVGGRRIIRRRRDREDMQPARQRVNTRDAAEGDTIGAVADRYGCATGGPRVYDGSEDIRPRAGGGRYISVLYKGCGRGGRHDRRGGGSTYEYECSAPEAAGE